MCVEYKFHASCSPAVSILVISWLLIESSSTVVAIEVVHVVIFFPPRLSLRPFAFIVIALFCIVFVGISEIRDEFMVWVQRG